MSLATYEKDPDAKLDYSINWNDGYLDTGESVAQSAWNAESGITALGNPAPSNDGYITTVWLEGGSLGESYVVTNSIVTSAGREDDRSITIVIVEK